MFCMGPGLRRRVKAAVWFDYGYRHVAGSGYPSKVNGFYWSLGFFPPHKTTVCQHQPLREIVHLIGL